MVAFRAKRHNPYRCPLLHPAIVTGKRAMDTVRTETTATDPVMGQSFRRTCSSQH